MARALQRLDLGSARAARVVSVDRGRTVLVDDGFGPRTVTVSGAVRHRGGGKDSALPVTGDWVAVDDDVVLAVLPRRGLLQRPTPTGPEPLVAHVDLVLVAHALAEDRSVARLPRFTALASAAGLPSVVLLTKVDLLEDPVTEVERVHAEMGGTRVLPVSSVSGVGVDAVRALIPIGTTAAILGASGAGKSRLANALLGEERQRTGAVREDDGRGRHVTVRRDLLTLPDAGLLIDTPGLRTVGVRGDVRGAFEDVTSIAQECRFADCAHEQEPGCAVREAVSEGTLSAERLGAFHKLGLEAAHTAAREDVVARRARERRARQSDTAYRREQRRAERD